MDERETRAKVRYWLAELAPAALPSVAGGESLVDDLEYHSLALLELAFALEDEFDLPPIDEESAAQIVTAGDVEDYVVAQLRAVASAAPGDGVR